MIIVVKVLLFCLEKTIFLAIIKYIFKIFSAPQKYKLKSIFYFELTLISIIIKNYVELQEL